MSPDADASGPSGRVWIAEFAERLGTEAPDEATVDELLAIAGVAAHSSERLAAPIACYLIGRAGVDAPAARRIADELAAGSATTGET